MDLTFFCVWRNEYLECISWMPSYYFLYWIKQITHFNSSAFCCLHWDMCCFFITVVMKTTLAIFIWLMFLSYIFKIVTYLKDIKILLCHLLGALFPCLSHRSIVHLKLHFSMVWGRHQITFVLHMNIHVTQHCLLKLPSFSPWNDNFALNQMTADMWVHSGLSILFRQSICLCSCQYITWVLGTGMESSCGEFSPIVLSLVRRTNTFLW